MLKTDQMLLKCPLKTSPTGQDSNALLHEGATDEVWIWLIRDKLHVCVAIKKRIFGLAVSFLIF